MPLSLRIDPWSPEYESSLQFGEDADRQLPRVDPFVERHEGDWAPVPGREGERPDPIAFVDGVQHVVARVVAQEGEAVAWGLLASVAVGTAYCRSDGATVTAEPPLRVLALSDGVSGGPFGLQSGQLRLEFAVTSGSRPGYEGAHEALGGFRNDHEEKLARRLGEDGLPLIVVDGRLRGQMASSAHGGSPTVGLVKTHHVRYLPDPLWAMLENLPAGQRTPLFLIEQRVPLYSWYLRLGERRPIEHGLAGVVRLETVASAGHDEAVRLADLTAAHLPSFASTAPWDPRAPQNLFPLSALERRLRHELGDPLWIRRAVETHLAGLTAGGAP